MNHALLLIDIQNDYFQGGKNELFRPEPAAAKAKLALEYCRNTGLVVYHVRHINTREDAAFFLKDSYGSEIHEYVKPLPWEKVFIKHAPNSFFDTGLAEELKEQQISRITVCGMMSHMCIDTTVRAARDLGFQTTLLHDACTTKDLIWENTLIPAATVHSVYMTSLQGTFAQVRSVEEFAKSCQ